MSYIVDVSPPEDKPSWYHNSFRPIIKDFRERTGGLKGIHTAWEQLYGFKILFDKFGYVKEIEFPSQEEATMFMLKWS